MNRMLIQKLLLMKRDEDTELLLGHSTVSERWQMQLSEGGFPAFKSITGGL